MKMNSCSATGGLSANWSYWERGECVSMHGWQDVLGEASAFHTHLPPLLTSHSLTVLQLMTHLPTQGTGPWLVGFELLPDDGEVGLMCGQAQHDQISCMGGAG